jgi:hypothetical protein
VRASCAAAAAVCAVRLALARCSRSFSSSKPVQRQIQTNNNNNNNNNNNYNNNTNHDPQGTSRSKAPIFDHFKRAPDGSVSVGEVDYWIRGCFRLPRNVKLSTSSLRASSSSSSSSFITRRGIPACIPHRLTNKHNNNATTMTTTLQ